MMSEVTSPVQKSGSNKTIFIIITVIGLLFLCFCCVIFMVMVLAINPAKTTREDRNNTVEETEEQRIPKGTDFKNYVMGEPANANGFILEILDYDADYFSNDSLYTPSTDRKLFAVEVLITNDTNDSIDYSNYNFVIKDSDNFEYYNIYYGEKQPSLMTGILEPGEEIRGWVTFEMPRTSENLTLTYQSYLTNTKISFQLR